MNSTVDRKRGLSRWWLALLSVPLITLMYYSWTVYDARMQTPSHVAAAYEKWGNKTDIATLGPERITMLLKVEDPAFFRHRGVDVDTPGAGITTLTQGLVKLLYFPDGFKPGIAKIRQTLIARHALDSLVSKEEQLRLFLNIAYFGHTNDTQIHGFEAAARAYFDKALTDLNDQQFLSLVAMLKAPNALKPRTPAHQQRLRAIEAYLSGKIAPASVLDVGYEGQQLDRLPQKIMVSFLRILAS